MTKNEFKKYKEVANKTLGLLIQEEKSSIKDIKIIFNIIMGFPYCLDEEGSYIFNGEFYDSFEKFPIIAKQEILGYKKS